MTTMELRRVILLGAVLWVTACSDSPPGRTFFERTIQPILEQKCAGNTSGCHAVNANDPFQFAAGNLDVTSFDNIQKRRDLLAPFGAYPHSLFLIKSVGAGRLKMQYGGAFRDIDVDHVGGAIIDVGSDAYFALQSWLDNGATENGLKPATPAVKGNGDCSTSIPPGFDPTASLAAGSFGQFRTTVQPDPRRQGLLGRQLPRRAAVGLLHHVRRHRRADRVQLQPDPGVRQRSGR